MTWKKLHRRASVRSDKPAIGIQKNGRIAWNAGTQEALGLPEYIELLYDEKNKRIGLKKTDSEDLDTFPVRQAAKQRTWGVSALGALRSIGIEVDKAYRAFAEVDGDIVSISVEQLVTDR